MEPLDVDRYSAWQGAYWKAYSLAPYSLAWRSVYWHLWRRFDWPFLNKDK